jgi:hypothetical protein
MTGLRQPHQDAVLPAADAARIRQALAACSRLLAWAQEHCGPQFTCAAAAAADAAGLGRAPGALAYEISLAIDSLDFSQAAGRTR